ncbi:MAG: hypothetical protein KZQ70_06015 [gamma proteobacterium symbiont of Lucinoma myriamae]|nr:hypothetical protein [gamma proteobacterium symbiont of Lucinoma myriamae]MCU7817873.1 hypothetical protein [gamma proteobacterium symbiont of Lucinoma myriamae]MCU7832080.1 hypothetical protein [gamma proteobacterium symbiont of Lucinoma myriamae]
MGVFVFIIVAVLVITESEPVVASDMSPIESVAFADADEGDIAQIFAVVRPVNVVVEKPVVQEIQPIDCYQQSVLVRDLTIAYEQRTYILADGSTCTPVN